MSNTLIRERRQGINHRCVLPAYRLSFDCIFSAVAGNEEDYVHPAHCGRLSCRKTGKRKRERKLQIARQRAGEHRRVLCGVISFLLSNFKIINMSKTIEEKAKEFAEKYKENFISNSLQADNNAYVAGIEVGFIWGQRELKDKIDSLEFEIECRKCEMEDMLREIHKYQ